MSSYGEKAQESDPTGSAACRAREAPEEFAAATAAFWDPDRLPDVKCSRPFYQGGASYGCGQCMPCRMNRRRLWTGRLLLEASAHERSVWVTLTYREAPECGVSPREFQLFMKRLRKEVAPEKVRFFAVGEYGGRTLRPHYHAALFGTANKEAVACAWSRDGELIGHVHFGECSPQALAYNCSHLTKGVRQQEEIERCGMHPTFQRMSLRPALGVPGLIRVKEWLTSKSGAEWLSASGDVPAVFRSDGQLWPLGRTLMAYLRKSSGWKDVGMPVEERSRLALEGLEKLLQNPRLVEAQRKTDALRARRKLVDQESRGSL